MRQCDKKGRANVGWREACGEGAYGAGKARNGDETHFLLIGFSSWLLRADTSGGGVDDGDDDSRSLLVRATGITKHGCSLADYSWMVWTVISETRTLSSLRAAMCAPEEIPATSASQLGASGGCLRLRGGARFILGTVLKTSGTGVKSININHASVASTLVDCERCQQCNVAQYSI